MTTIKNKKLELLKKGRRRFIGSVIFALSVVIFVPKFFERPEKSQNTKINIEIPKKPKVSKDLLIFEEKKEISKFHNNPDDKTSASKKKNYYLQIAVLSNQQKAFEIIEKFNRKGINVFYENINLKGKKNYRLRTGPYKDITMAKKIKKEITDLEIISEEPTVLKLKTNINY